MADVTLFSARACPFAHRTRLVLSEKRVDFETREIDLANKPPWFNTVSGYGKVPAIEHAGTRLWESAIVNEYLDEVFPEPPLQPKVPGLRAVARIWVDYANTRFVQAFGALLRGAATDKSTAQRDLAASLAYIESEGLARLSTSGPFFFGKQVGLVDFAFYPWFERWAALEHYRGFAIPAEHRRLLEWRAAVRELPSVKAHENPTAYYIERYARHAAPAN